MNERQSLEGEVGLMWFLGRQGVYPMARVRDLVRRRQIQVNGDKPRANQLISEGDVLRIHRHEYRAVPGGGRGRLIVQAIGEEPSRISGKVRLQCGYHKCLTMFFRDVMDQTLPGQGKKEPRFRHFFHRPDVFYRECKHYKLGSLSCHVVDFDRFDDILVSRIIRDPRDLLVSGYFYHKRGGEPFCKYLDPNDADYAVVKGTVPDCLPAGTSLQQFLNESDVETGLLAEIDFRKKHFENMMAWPDDGPRLKTFRYENIMGNEPRTFVEMARFHELGLKDTLKAGFYGRQLSAKKRAPSSKHIRNPNSGQWRAHFTPKVADKFNALYPDLLDKLGYPKD